MDLVEPKFMLVAVAALVLVVGVIVRTVLAVAVTQRLVVLSMLLAVAAAAAAVNGQATVAALAPPVLAASHKAHLLGVALGLIKPLALVAALMLVWVPVVAAVAPQEMRVLLAETEAQALPGMELYMAKVATVRTPTVAFKVQPQVLVKVVMPLLARTTTQLKLGYL
tara:strand:+ start:348 stop:848 length:501 start_codon:yes stop_codon:yes gene_type:complete